MQKAKSLFPDRVSISIHQIAIYHKVRVTTKRKKIEGNSPRLRRFSQVEGLREQSFDFDTLPDCKIFAIPINSFLLLNKKFK